MASEHFQPGEGKCGLRFRLEPGADANHPWRFYGVHRLEKRYGGKVVLIGGRLCCRASAGGSPCAFAREFGSWFFKNPCSAAASPHVCIGGRLCCRASAGGSPCAFAREFVVF